MSTVEVEVSVVQELEDIRKRHRGVLRAADVVDYAADPDTALHSRFQWDDSEAARQYRLWQARELIRVAVDVLPGTEHTTRCFVSLSDDRQNDGGGYRAMVDVLRDPTMRQALLAQAKDEADRWRQKYRNLTELVPIFAAMDRTFKKK